MLRFADVRVMFDEVGVPPNVSEVNCARWLGDLALGPLVDAFRSEVDISTAVKAGQDIASQLLAASRAAFAGEPRMSETIMTLEAALILFESSSAENRKLPHTPSTLKEAVLQLTEIPYDNGPVMLAVRHGVVAQHIMQTALEKVSGNAQDEVATDRFRSAALKLSELAASEDDFVAAEVTDLFRKIETAVGMWGTSSREEHSKDMIAAIDSMDKLLSNWADVALGNVKTDLTMGLVHILGWLDKGVGKLDGEGVPAPSQDNGEHECSKDAANPDGSDSNSKDDEASRQRTASSLEGYLETLDSQLQPEWVEISSILDLALKVELAIIQALDATSITISPHTKLFGKRAQYEAYMDALAFVRTILQASQCIITGESQRAYGALLEEWSSWQRRAQEQREELGLPVLEQITQGAKSMQHLRKWHDDQGAMGTKGSPIHELVGVIVLSSLGDVFGALTKCIVDDALDAFSSKSPAGLLEMQDGNMVKRCDSEGRLGNVVPLMLGGGSNEKLNGMLAMVLNTLKEREWKLCDDIIWPHSYSAGMAKECLRVLQHSIVGDAPDRHVLGGSCPPGRSTLLSGLVLSHARRASVTYAAWANVQVASSLLGSCVRQCPMPNFGYCLSRAPLLGRMPFRKPCMGGVWRYVAQVFVLACGKCGLPMGVRSSCPSVCHAFRLNPMCSVIRCLLVWMI